jgi:hypothetical protein
MKLRVSLGILVSCERDSAHRLTKFEDIVIKPYQPFKVRVIFRILDDPLVAPEKPRRFRFHIFGTGIRCMPLSISCPSLERLKS